MPRARRSEAPPKFKNTNFLGKNKLSNLKIDSALFVENKDIDKNFLLAAKNVPKIDILPLVGLNVYDILRRDYLVFSSSAVTGIHERLNK